MVSIAKTELELRILQLCENALVPKGFRVVDVDCRIGHRSLVRIFIERASASLSEVGNDSEGKESSNVSPSTAKEAGPSLDDCANASRLLEPVLDADEALIAGAYDLEVSSPGLDRRLRLDSDFLKAVGQDVKLKLTDSITGLGANVTGHLVGLEGGDVHVDVNKKEWAIPLKKIKQANTVWRFQ